MSISRSPSPALGGGWSSPGLHTPSGQSSPASSPMWDSSRIGVSPTVTTSNGYATNKGRSFLGRMRKLSTSLPRFRPGQDAYVEKDKHGQPGGFRIVRGVRSIMTRMSRKFKLRLLFVLLMTLLIVLWYTTRTFTPSHPSAFAVGGNIHLWVIESNLMLTWAQRSTTTGGGLQASAAAKSSLSSWGRTWAAA